MAKATIYWNKKLFKIFIHFFNHFITDAEVQKHGEQTGLDTLVVHALTDEC